MQNCYLVDSSIFIFRAWYVYPDSVRNTDGQPINALLGFADFVHELLRTVQPKYIAFAFDESLGPCVRRQIYPLYKANRLPAPADLKHQFGLCRELVGLLGLSHLGSAAYEADDIIGALAARQREAGQRIHILTADKDLTQLLGETDTWWDYYRDRRWTARDVSKHWGVPPQQIADLLAIAGDKVDNIPGVPGIGVATAARLLKKFGSLDNLLANLEQISSMKTRGAARFQILLQQHADTVRLARRLTGIFDQMPLPADARVERQPIRLDALSAFLQEQGLGEQIARWQQLALESRAQPL